MTENSPIFSIDSASLSKFVASSRSCHFGQVCELEAKFGQVVFDFSSISAEYCMVHTRRQSGNGIVSISVGEHNFEQSILSKLKHSIKIDLSYGKRIEIFRPHRSRGNIEIYGIDFYNNLDNLHIKQNNIDWSNILRSCKEYKCIKISDNNRLFASEGGEIIANQIINIVSDPPNMFKIYDNNTKIKFLGPCEVLQLNISADGINRIQPLYPHFNTTINNNVLIPNISSSNIEAQNILRQKMNSDPRPIFDSAESISLKLLKKEDFEDVGGAVLLKHRGRITIPVSNLKKEHEYIVIVEANKKSGNGKLCAWIEPLETPKSSLIFASGHRKTIRMTVLNGSNTTDQQQFVVVGRPDSATGDLVIYRIIIIEGTNIEHVISALVNTSIKSQSYTQSTKPVTVTDDDQIFANLKKYARYSSSSEPPIMFEKLTGYFGATSMSGLKWLNKVGKFIPNIKPAESGKQPVDLLFATIDNLIPAKNIYLEEYDNLHNIDILSQAKRVYTPSFDNWIELKERLSSEIIYCAKPWPYVSPQELRHINTNFILLINRNEKITQSIVELYKQNNWPKPVILNARNNFNNDVYLTNDYLPYDNLIWLIENAMCVVDFDYVKNVKSSVMDTALALGTPVVSNNWHVREKLNAVFALSDDWIDKGTIPSQKTIINSINNSLQNLKKQSKSINLNQELFKWISEILSE